MAAAPRLTGLDLIVLSYVPLDVGARRRFITADTRARRPQVPVDDVRLILRGLEHLGYVQLLLAERDERLAQRRAG